MSTEPGVWCGLYAVSMLRIKAKEEEEEEEEGCRRNQNSAPGSHTADPESAAYALPCPVKVPEMQREVRRAWWCPLRLAILWGQRVVQTL